MDKLTPAERSALMGKIPGKDTKPELMVRSLLHAMGYRFRLHRKDLPGKPDIVLPRHRLVIFVHGCFWHGHRKCRLAQVPATRSEFWQEKFIRNAARDQESECRLRKLGWNVLVVWECEVRDPKWLFETLAENLLD